MARRHSNNSRAATRSRAGMTRELHQVREKNRPNPSRGGSNGYQLWFREKILEKVAAYEGPGLLPPDLGVSKSSVYRWIHRIQPFERTGGAARSKIVGRDQMLLAIGLFIHPDSNADELAAFIYNRGGALYSNPVISKRMSELDLTKKKCSVEAYQAFSERNLRRVRHFWIQPPPLGVFMIERRRLIDIDEMAVCIQRCNRKYGHAHVSIRIRKPGHYIKAEKLTVIMAIEPGDPNLPDNVDGSIQNPRRWFQIRQVAGTNAVDYATFVDGILREFETNPISARVPGNTLDQDRLILHDNLASHLTPLVVQTIEGRPTNHEFLFRVVPRPPYQPKYGPIEYIFGQIGAKLQQSVKPHWNLLDLRFHLINICSSLGRLNFGDGGNFNRTFEHCGYQENNNNQDNG